MPLPGRPTTKDGVFLPAPRVAKTSCGNSKDSIRLGVVRESDIRNKAGVMEGRNAAERAKVVVSLEITGRTGRDKGIGGGEKRWGEVGEE